MSTFTDQMNMAVTMESQMARCRLNRKAWLQLHTNDLPDQSHDLEGQSNDLNKHEGQKVNEHKVSSCEDGHVNPNNTEGQGQMVSYNMSCGDGLVSNFDPNNAHTFNSIEEAIVWVAQGKDPLFEGREIQQVAPPPVLASANHVQVLCTGSLHLIGGVMRIFSDPSLTD